MDELGLEFKPVFLGVPVGIPPSSPGSQGPSSGLQEAAG